MHIDYNIENGYELQNCPVCKYVYRYYYDRNRRVANTEKPFIKAETSSVYIKSIPWELELYICPCCGVLQTITDERG